MYLVPSIAYDGYPHKSGSIIYIPMMANSQTLDHNASPTNQSHGYSRWMSDLPDEVTKLPINKLAIPGSHNSGSYYLDPTTPMSPGRRFLYLLV